MARKRSADNLTVENARWRRKFRAAEETLAEREQIIAEQNKLLLHLLLADTLADPADFHAFIDMDTVTDERGVIIWSRADQLITELLAAKPHLAATRGETGNPVVPSLLDWFLNRSG